jgi:hypothetical protein
MVAELQRALTELGLEQYLANCLGAGIQNWQSLTTITEAELVALGVRIGHRQKLQRATESYSTGLSMAGQQTSTNTRTTATTSPKPPKTRAGKH